ncbi:hypothetical protein CXG81DRAFT_18030 [Caulochytrium protostelioides]|uniref:HSP20-like chaperone n=1 Tax=Caulochytrium protostelioides TaxID=1555241 RepID=A0A4P9XAX3_9FUNG|nr:HSP20-like chaperone [Caulochytrium protostelioides]RKP02280.1 hypothetical protein CXG81DRAFT_18030 [Caulochytrium protostelioides]|eukprot:RKP02280.1 hypothetical protein CXG81DRAFT_18030 [Caulochytrium protostelioides]
MAYYNALSPFSLLDDMLSSPFEHAGRARQGKRGHQAKPSHVRMADQPAVDVTETDQEVTMAMNLPGLTRDQITIDFDSAKNHLTVGYAQRHDSSSDEEFNHIEEDTPAEENGDKAQVATTDKDNKNVKSTDESSESKSMWTRLYRERPDYAGFSRTFAFQDPMDVEKAHAQMENGVLTLKIPKLRHKTTARISIC